MLCYVFSVFYLVMFSLAAWFYAQVCAVGAVRMDRTLVLKMMFSHQIPQTSPIDLS